MTKPMRSFVLCIFLFFVLSQGTVSAQCDILPPNSPLIIQTNCSGGMGTVCTNLAVGEEANVRFLLDGSPMNETVPCAFDTIRYYRLNSIVTIGSFAPYYLEDWEVNGTTHSMEFIYVSQLIDSMNIWDPSGNWDYSFPQSRITGGNPQNNYSSLKIEVIITNTTLSSDYTTEAIPTKVGLELPIGLHLVQAWDIARACRDSLVVNVVCTETARLNLTLDRGGSRIVCLEQDELLRDVEKIDNLTSNAEHYTWQRISEDCVRFNGRSIGTDFARLVICDRFGICDTTNVSIQVRDPIQRTFQDAILIGEAGEFCVDKSALALPSTIERFGKACTNQEDILDINYEDESLCIQYEGIAEGFVEECLEVCDAFGNCDTLRLKLNVVEPLLVSDTLLVGAETGQYCLDMSAFDPESVTIDRACMTENSIIQFNETSNCFTYESDEIQSDSTCVWLIDAVGNARYVLLRVLVRPPVPSVRIDSVFINQSTEICLSQDELPGQLRTLENLCASTSTIADFTPISEACVEVTGLELGQAEACFELCDNFGYCDTTYLRIHVIPYEELPNAEDDTATANQNETVEIPIQDNDNILGGVQSIRILVPPQYGQAYIEVNGQVTYQPDAQNCTGMDAFQYEICNNAGCDVATVSIEVNCSGVEVYTAMSPNGDGLNDAFFIANIDAYPINKLQVFNRHGALVYEKSNYQNDWFGTWNGRILPDGTYFYLFEIEDKGQTQVFRGYVELHR